ncbi:type II toxin-antitoxin system RelE/ParE family toxin [Bradyrhizobium cenepequi]
MKLVFDDRAIAEYENIYHSIAQDSPSAASAVVERLFSSIELLSSFPFMGRAGRDADTFEWPVPRLPYIAVYEVDKAQDRVIVTGVFHGAQDREAGKSRNR